MFKRRLANLAVGALLAAAPILAAIPAHADSRQIGVPGTDTRCFPHDYKACLYWGPSIGTTYAYWPTNASWSDLRDHYFWDGTGQGSGTAVGDNSAAMYCGGVVTECVSWAVAGYSGNVDFEFPYQVGKLDLTNKNNEAITLD